MEASDVHAILKERGISDETLRRGFGVGPATFAQAFLRGWYSLEDLDELLEDEEQAATRTPEPPAVKSELGFTLVTATTKKRTYRKQAAKPKASEDVERPPQSDECAKSQRRARAHKRHAYQAFSEAANLYGTRLG